MANYITVTVIKEGENGLSLIQDAEGRTCWMKKENVLSLTENKSTGTSTAKKVGSVVSGPTPSTTNDESGGED
jgi:hypothetical protein